MSVKPGSAWWILGMGAISTYGEEPEYPSPGTVRELTAVATSGLSVRLSWSMPEQGLNIANVYIIYVNGEQVGVSTTTSYEVTGLVPETQYSFAVVSENSYGIRSEPATIDAFTLASTPEAPIINYVNNTRSIGQFVIVNFDPKVAYSGQKVSGSDGLTISDDIVSIPQNSRYTITAGWTVDMEQSGAAPIERKAPKEEFVATGPFKCHGCGTYGCCADPGGCGCGTWHLAGAFPYDGMWACCEPGYWRWVNYGANYTWSGNDYTNGNGEWWRIT